MQDSEQLIENNMTANEIMKFAKRNLKKILLGGVVGLLLSTVYLAMTPKKFEAQMQIQMAQFVVTNTNTNTNTSTSTNIGNNLFASNSEEPLALIGRLRSPTSYSKVVKQNCGLREHVEFGDYLGGMLKVVPVNKVLNAVEITIQSQSSEQARNCASAILAMIAEQQQGLIDERLTGRSAQLQQYQQSLLEKQQQQEKINSSALSNCAYLANVDTMNWLRTRIDALQEEIVLSRLHPAKLIAPIYAPERPVPRRIGLVLFLGLMIGLMFGSLSSLGYEEWRKLS